MKNDIFHTCNIKDDAKCKTCNFNDKLICKTDKNFRNKFLLTHINFRLTIFVALIYIGLITNEWWLLLLYCLVFVLNFFIVEPRMLCSHCPFYAQEGKFLKCNTLYGIPKIAKYRPCPMKTYEKAIQFIFGALVDLLPLLLFIQGYILFSKNNVIIENYFSLSAFVLFHLLLLLQLEKTIRKDVCSKCPNFSCPMNKVSKEVKNEYLKKESVH